MVLATLIPKGSAQGGEEGFKEEGQWLLLVFMVGVISIVIGAVLFGALILRTMKAWFSQRRSIEEKPIHDENEKEEIKEHTPKELRRRTPVPKGSPGSEKSGISTSSTRSMTFPVQHLEWSNREWGVTIPIGEDEENMRRPEDAEGAEGEKGRSFRSSHGAASSSSHVAPAFSASTKGGGGKGSPGPRVQDAMPRDDGDSESGRLPAFVTLWGNQCHNYVSCPRFRRSRLRRSPLRPDCILTTEEDRNAAIFSAAPGEMAHYVRNCRRGNTVDVCICDVGCVDSRVT